MALYDTKKDEQHKLSGVEIFIRISIAIALLGAIWIFITRTEQHKKPIEAEPIGLREAPAAPVDESSSDTNQSPTTNKNFHIKSSDKAFGGVELGQTLESAGVEKSVEFGDNYWVETTERLIPNEHHTHSDGKVGMIEYHCDGYLKAKVSASIDGLNCTSNVEKIKRIFGDYLAHCYKEGGIIILVKNFAYFRFNATQNKVEEFGLTAYPKEFDNPSEKYSPCR